MATFVTGELYEQLDGRLHEIKRQIRQSGGYPFDPEALKDLLQQAVEGRFAVNTPNILKILRTFNPTKFLGEGWKVEEEDKRSKELTEVDLNKVQFVTMLKEGETSIKGEEKLKRLKKSDYIRLDADIFFTLWNNKSRIPESWKEKVNGNTRYIFFDGAVLRRPRGDRCVLYLCWRGGGWDWRCHWLGLEWHASLPSAVLAS